MVITRMTAIVAATGGLVYFRVTRSSEYLSTLQVSTRHLFKSPRGSWTIEVTWVNTDSLEGLYCLTAKDVHLSADIKIRRLNPSWTHVSSNIFLLPFLGASFSMIFIQIKIHRKCAWGSVVGTTAPVEIYPVKRLNLAGRYRLSVYYMRLSYLVLQSF